MEKKPVFSKKEQDRHSEYPVGVNTWEKVFLWGWNSRNIHGFLHSNSHSNSCMKSEKEYKSSILTYVNDTLYKTCNNIYNLIVAIARENHLFACHHRRFFHVHMKRNMLRTCHKLKQPLPYPLAASCPLPAGFLNVSFMSTFGLANLWATVLLWKFFKRNSKNLAN